MSDGYPPVAAWLDEAVQPATYTTLCRSGAAAPQRLIRLTLRIIRGDDEAYAVTLPSRERTGVKDPP